MYEELVKQLRAYAEEHCPLDRSSGICGCVLAHNAADAIEELNKRPECPCWYGDMRFCSMIGKQLPKLSKEEK